MRRLDYSRAALTRYVALAVIAVPVLLLVPLDRDIAEGHVFGLWVGLLYAIGPIGRWTICGGVIALLGFAAARALILMTIDTVALNAGASGLVVQTIWRRHTLGWTDVASLDLTARTVRGRTYRWITIRWSGGGVERRSRLAIDMLDTDDARIAQWLDVARAMLAESRRPALTPAGATAPVGFGRKPVR